MARSRFASGPPGYVDQGSLEKRCGPCPARFSAGCASCSAVASVGPFALGPSRSRQAPRRAVVRSRPQPAKTGQYVKNQKTELTMMPVPILIMKESLTSSGPGRQPLHLARQQPPVIIITKPKGKRRSARGTQINHGKHGHTECWFLHVERARTIRMSPTTGKKMPLASKILALVEKLLACTVTPISSFAGSATSGASVVDAMVSSP